MAAEVERDGAARAQLLLIFFKNLQKCPADCFGDGAWHAQLDDTWQACSAQCKEAGAVQILSHDYGVVIACVIEDRLVRIPDASEIFPMGSGDSERCQVFEPTRREVLVKDEFHDARSS